MTSRCKQLAMDYQVPIVTVAQLNRQVETRAEKEPILADLKESGSIEQDSDIVIMLYRSEKEGLFLKIAKNRSGDTGYFPIKSDFATNRFLPE